MDSQSIAPGVLAEEMCMARSQTLAKCSHCQDILVTCGLVAAGVPFPGWALSVQVLPLFFPSSWRISLISISTFLFGVETHSTLEIVPCLAFEDVIFLKIFPLPGGIPLP